MKNLNEKNLWAGLIHLLSQWSLLPSSTLNREEFLSILFRRLQPFKLGKMHDSVLRYYKHMYLPNIYCA